MEYNVIRITSMDELRDLINTMDGHQVLQVEIQDLEEEHAPEGYAAEFADLRRQLGSDE